MTIRDIPAPQLPPAGEVRLTNRAGRLNVLDPNGQEKEVAYSDDNGTYDGEPSNYVANVQATCDWTVGSTTVSAEAIPAGAGGNLMVLNIKDPATLDPPEGPSRPAATAEVNGNEIDIYPATNDGDNAEVVITTSGTAMTVKHFRTGTSGNGTTVAFALKVSDGPALDSNTESVILPSKALAARWNPGAGLLLIDQGTAAGVTAAKLTLTESVGASGGSLKIEQRAAYIGTWANNRVRCQVAMAGVSTPLSAVAAVVANKLEITINLATTNEGLPDNSANTEALVVAAVQAALDAAPVTFDAATDWGDVLLCSRINAGAEFFSSPNAWVTMGDGTGSNTAGVNALADNTANAVAFLKTAIEALPDTGTKFDVTADGTGHVSGGTSETFAGGGENYSPTSRVLDVIAAVEAVSSSHFTLDVTAGDGSDVVPIGGDVLDWNSSGVDEVAGTPGKLGRLAVGFATGESTVKSVWTSMKDDPTTTQDGWVKTFTGS